MTKLTFIVTVYNTENLIARCMDSLFAQELPSDDYEILLVDNGSTDSSGKVCDDFKAKYPNVTVLHLENLGAGASRNSGVLAAKGEYIWYIDSDDTIEPNVCKGLLEKAFNDKLDVLAFDFELAYEDANLNITRKEVHSISCDNPGKVLTGEEFMLQTGMPSAQWCSLYRRQFLLDEGLEFIERICYEDQDYTPRAYFLAKRAAFVPVMVYNYVQRAGSITKRTDLQEQRASDYLKVCDSLHDFVTKRITKGTPIYNIFMSKIAFDFAQSLRFCDKSYEISKEYEKKPYYPLYISPGTSIKERMKYQLINFSVSLYLTIYKLLKK